MTPEGLQVFCEQVLLLSPVTNGHGKQGCPTTLALKTEASVGYITQQWTYRQLKLSVKIKNAEQCSVHLS